MLLTLANWIYGLYLQLVGYTKIPNSDPYLSFARFMVPSDEILIGKHTSLKAKRNKLGGVRK